MFTQPNLSQDHSVRSLPLLPAALPDLPASSPIPSSHIGISRDNYHASSYYIPTRTERQEIIKALLPQLIALQSPLALDYHATLTSCGHVIQDKSRGKAKCFSCKRRWCVLCAHNRQTDIAYRYLPQMQKWEDAQAVTLTLPCCTRAEVVDVSLQMIAGFKAIGIRWNKQYHRQKQAFPLVCLRSQETHYNPELDHYHPHFHLLVKNAAMAQHLVAQWLTQFPAANSKAQYVEPVKTMLSWLRYIVKPAVPFSAAIPPAQLVAWDTIFQVLALKRTLVGYGLETLPKKQPVIAQPVDQETGTNYGWAETLNEWVAMSTGKTVE